jgi:hypothetical protein
MKTRSTLHSFKTRSDPASQSEIETGPDWRKNKGKKNSADPAGWLGNPVGQARLDQKLGCNPLTFVFLLKRRRFDFLKKINPRDPVTQSKYRIRALDRAGCKNYATLWADIYIYWIINNNWTINIYRYQKLDE